MFRASITILSVAALSTVLAVQPQNTPPDHPPIRPPIPAGHPEVGAPPTTQPGGQPPPPAQPPKADPADVASIDAVINAYYDVISGPPGEERDWNRFRSLFNSDARFITSKSINGRSASLKLTPDQFVMANQKYFEKGGYYEREIHREVDTYGNIAQAFSTYEARQREDAPDPYSRGINSIQLLSDGNHWWIVTVMWDYERPDENPLPAEYLP